MRFWLLLFLPIFWLFNNPGSIKIQPDKGYVGDQISIVCSQLFERVETVKFTGDQTTPTLEILDTGIRLQVTVPPKAQTGPVTLILKSGPILSAGNFIVLKKPDIAPIDSGTNSAASNGGSLAPGGRTISAPPGPPPPPLKPSSPMEDPYLDLPVDPHQPIITKPPLPPPPPPKPPEIPPSIYGKDLISENSTIFYVIDISGSMGWDMGQYTTPDGKTETGNRLDRAKAELIKSVISLPKNFKFNMLSYDCSVYPWLPELVIATDSNKQLALSWIRSLQPQGGTGSGPAVAVALNIKACKLYVLLTDGQPNCPWMEGEPQCIPNHLKMIRENNSQKAIINVFGIGATGVCKQFCQDVASQSGGSYTDVR